jgi:DNA polymerase I-like protein with 3'-5' exonuclease and polymerase domains
MTKKKASDEDVINVQPITPITYGSAEAPIYVICEPHTLENSQLPCSKSSMTLFLSEAIKNGFKQDDFYFIQLCAKIPEDIKKSKAKTWAFMEGHVAGLQALLEGNSKPIVTMGDYATRAAIGRSCAITKVRGTWLENRVYPILSPSFCRAVLEQLPLFKSDIKTLYKLYENDFDIAKLGSTKKNYYWCTDLSSILSAKPQIVGIDTETTGLRTQAPGFKVLTVQIAYNDKDVAVCPLHPNFWPGEFNEEQCNRLQQQIKQFCEDPSIRKVGHNVNYETSALASLGINLKGVLADTQLLAWFIDENMQTKSLDDVVRRWLPEFAGYNDQHNVNLDKSDMINVDPVAMLEYAGGDALVTLNVFFVLWELLGRNKEQMKLFMKLKMPGLKAFQKMEQQGILIDQEYLSSVLKTEVAKEIVDLEARLLDMVPKAVIRKHLDSKKPLKFSRHDFTRDILFSDIGFNLTPQVFTKGTKDNSNEEEKVPSTSAKDHLPYFLDEEGVVGDFVHDLIEFTKLTKLYTTYIDKFAENYIHHDGKIHPQFNLHITVTGRSSSRGPNAQNFPSRGRWAKAYKKQFVASPGYKFISADLSQIELRLIAWESRDPVMLQAYREGKDIHKITAMAVSGHTEETWAQLPKDEQKLLRYRAKAVNFGLCYGMYWTKFKRFAKTDYGLDLTDQQAKEYYDTYHRLYANIKKWHKSRTEEAKHYGYVMSLHGAKRNVPSIHHEDKYIQGQAARQAINSPIQGFGSDLGVLAIARLSMQCDSNIIRPVAFIHDDIILEVKDGHEEEGLNTLLWVLNNAPIKQIFGINPPIPILAEPDIGLNLGEMYELYDLKPEDKPFWLPELKIKPQKPEWWQDQKEQF